MTPKLIIKCSLKSLSILTSALNKLMYFYEITCNSLHALTAQLN